MVITQLDLSLSGLSLDGDVNDGNGDEDGGRGNGGVVSTEKGPGEPSAMTIDSNNTHSIRVLD